MKYGESNGHVIGDVTWPRTTVFGARYLQNEWR